MARTEERASARWCQADAMSKEFLERSPTKCVYLEREERVGGADFKKGGRRRPYCVWGVGYIRKGDDSSEQLPIGARGALWRPHR